MTQKMKAAVVRKFKEPLDIDEVAIPTPGAGQILVNIAASGVCHTDLHAADGNRPVKPKPPFIPGHEGIGHVAAALRFTQVSSPSNRQVMTTRAAAASKAPPGPTRKQYKPLLGSAAANSILNAQQFRYTDSVSTDIRKTFANFRRNASKQDQPSAATNVRTLTKKPMDAMPGPSLASLRSAPGVPARYHVTRRK